MSKLNLSYKKVCTIIHRLDDAASFDGNAPEDDPELAPEDIPEEDTYFLTAYGVADDNRGLIHFGNTTPIILLEVVLYVAAANFTASHVDTLGTERVMESAAGPGFAFTLLAQGDSGLPPLVLLPGEKIKFTSDPVASGGFLFATAIAL